MIKRQQQNTTDRSRNGISLLEVVIAVAIFLAAMTAIYRLVTTGTSASVRGQMHTEAVMRAESKLGEVISQLVPLEPVDSQAMEMDENQSENWYWSMDVTQGEEEYSPMLIEITVTHQNPAGDADALFTLSRSIRDPQLFVDAAIAAEEAAADEEDEE